MVYNWSQSRPVHDETVGARHASPVVKIERTEKFAVCKGSWRCDLQEPFFILALQIDWQR